MNLWLYKNFFTLTWQKLVSASETQIQLVSDPSQLEKDDLIKRIGETLCKISAGPLQHCIEEMQTRIKSLE